MLDLRCAGNVGRFIPLHGIYFAFARSYGLCTWNFYDLLGDKMKINVKALLLWGLIFPFIISTLPIRKSTTSQTNAYELTNSHITFDELEQIFDILEISINGTFGEFIHNSVINSVAGIDEGLKNDQFSITYFSENNVDAESPIASILSDEQLKLARLHVGIYEVLCEYMPENKLPENFIVRTKVIIPNKRISKDKIRAYELEIVSRKEQLVELKNQFVSDDSSAGIEAFLDQQEIAGYLKLTEMSKDI